MRNNSNENNSGSSNSVEPSLVSWPIIEHGEYGHNGLHSDLNPNKYGSHGKENFFQGKNVQTNKGKAKVVEKPRPTTYKEALQRHNSFSDD